MPQYTLEELENAEMTVPEATNADSNRSAGTSLNNDQWEELAESLTNIKLGDNYANYLS